MGNPSNEFVAEQRVGADTVFRGQTGMYPVRLSTSEVLMPIGRKL
jgi:hypothetical protein